MWAGYIHINFPLTSHVKIEKLLNNKQTFQPVRRRVTEPVDLQQICLLGDFNTWLEVFMWVLPAKFLIDFP